MNNPGLWKAILFVSIFSMLEASGRSTLMFTTLLSFDGTDGAGPFYGSLVEGFDGNFYGTTADGGAYGYGTVFKITPGGTPTTLYSFCAQAGCADGEAPLAGLVQATNGNFYGTTADGGAYGFGTVFKITPGGTLTTLHSFDLSDGANPNAGLVQGNDGNLYGTTVGGGFNGLGTVFKITPGGTLTTLHSFDSTDGANPYGGLLQATNGNFYGTTSSGGANLYYGTVFKITSGGTLTTLHNFDNTDGYDPSGVLVQASSGNFYGTTYGGGVNGDGTIFKITPGGTLTTVHSFGGPDGAFPTAGLVQATDGNFYGTTSSGGSLNDGTVFEITPAGVLTTLHSFDDLDGAYPYAGLLQATNGELYGTTNTGGSNGAYGTVFSLALGFGPFVQTLPVAGKIGATVMILGNNLTGATSVSFNGTAATFTVVRSTQIKTTVPSGATTGKVQVITPNRTLTSNVNFQVLP